MIVYDKKMNDHLQLNMNWVGMLVGMGLRNVTIVGPVKSLMNMYFFNDIMHHVNAWGGFENYADHVILIRQYFS